MLITNNEESHANHNESSTGRRVNADEPAAEPAVEVDDHERYLVSMLESTTSSTGRRVNADEPAAEPAVEVDDHERYLVSMLESTTSSGGNEEAPKFAGGVQGVYCACLAYDGYNFMGAFPNGERAGEYATKLAHEDTDASFVVLGFKSLAELVESLPAETVEEALSAGRAKFFAISHYTVSDEDASADYAVANPEAAVEIFTQEYRYGKGSPGREWPIYVHHGRGDQLAAVYQASYDAGGKFSTTQLLQETFTVGDGHTSESFAAFGADHAVQEFLRDYSTRDLLEGQDWGITVWDGEDKVVGVFDARVDASQKVVTTRRDLAEAQATAPTPTGGRGRGR